MPGTGLAVVRDRVTTGAARLTMGQKLALGAAFVATVVGLLAVSRMGSGPQMAVLYADLDPEAAASVVDGLESRGVAYQLTDAGRTVEVPKAELYQTRLALSAEGLPDVGGGWSILDEQGLTTSEFDQRVGFQRALEGELARTIGVIEGVERANVHLVIPRSDLFVEDETKASASVLLQLQPGSSIGAGQVQSIVNLVSSSVEGLTPGAVTVTDNSGRTLAAPGGSMSSVLEGEQRATQSRAYETAVAGQIEALLAAVVGPGNARVAVTADLDFDSVTTTTEEYRDPQRDDGARTVSGETSRVEQYTGADPGVAGVLGAEDELVDGEARGAGGTTYSLDEQDTAYALDKTVTSTERAPGVVRSLAVAVLLDEAAIGAERVADVQTIVEAASGVDLERGDTVAVSRLPFDTSAAEAVASELEAVAAAESRANLVGLIRTVGTIVLALVVLVVGLLLLRKGRRTVVQSIELDELARQAEQQPPKALQAAAAQPPAPPTVDDLADLIKNQPDEMASLLRGWMGTSGAAR